MSGTIFKEKRLSLGLDLEQISEALKIRKRYLEAIEEDNYEDIQPGSYIKGYVKLYSKYLGLGDSEIIDIIKQPKTELVVYEARPDIKDPSWSLINISLILMFCVILYGKNIIHKTFDKVSYILISKEEKVNFAPNNSIQDLLGKYADLNKVVILVKKPTYLEIKDHNNQILFSGKVESGDVHFAPNTEATTISVNESNDIELFCEDLLANPSQTNTSTLLIKKIIFSDKK